jgi:hypothetical protein
MPVKPGKSVDTGPGRERPSHTESTHRYGAAAAYLWPAAAMTYAASSQTC